MSEVLTKDPEAKLRDIVAGVILQGVKHLSNNENPYFIVNADSVLTPMREISGRDDESKRFFELAKKCLNTVYANKFCVEMLMVGQYDSAQITMYRRGERPKQNVRKPKIQQLGASGLAELAFDILHGMKPTKGMDWHKKPLTRSNIQTAKDIADVFRSKLSISHLVFNVNDIHCLESAKQAIDKQIKDIQNVKRFEALKNVFSEEEIQRMMKAIE